MPTLLILWHSRTGASAALAQAALAGALATDGVTTLCRPVIDVQLEDLLEASAFIFVGPENLGSLSGAMKEMFDTAYYPLLGRIEGRRYAHIVAAGSDGTGAARQLARIVTGWRLQPVADPLVVSTAAQTADAIAAAKTVKSDDLSRAKELGALLAAGLALGMF